MILFAIFPLFIALGMSVSAQETYSPRVVVCDMKKTTKQVYYDARLNRCYVRDYK